VTRRALVTGASSGIGEHLARTLHERGFDVVLVARRRDRLDAIAAALDAIRPDAVEVLAADLLDTADRDRVVDRVRRGDIDVLVNNAGFGPPGAVAESDPEVLGRVVRLNAEVVVRLTRAALEPMCERGSGHIVQMASIAAFQPSPYFAVYSATKAFVLSFSEAVHEEVRGSGVRVTAICPGFTRTGFQESNDAHASFLPQALWSEPHHVTAAVLRALDANPAVVIPRWHDWLTTQLTGWLPRAWVRRIAGRVGGSV
jgi:short-subunit dehydrogenase